MTVEAQANGQDVAGVDIYVTFDPTYLEVQDITPGTTLGTQLQKTFDNATGMIKYSAGTFTTPYPNARFTVATILFHTKAITTNVQTNLNFSTSGPDVTLVTSGSDLVLRNTSGASVNIQQTPNLPLTIVSSTLAEVLEGTDYSQNLTASGGVGPYFWTADGLPDGLSISTGGVITGQPTTPGNYSVKFNVHDSLVPANSVDKIMTLKVYMRYDVNGDGEVDMGDAVKIERIYFGLDATTPAADANGDGVVNLMDITKVERIILRMDLF
jgi:hypothetical protein